MRHSSTVEFMRCNRFLPNYARAAEGHMPFPGHRTQKQIREASETARVRRAREWGYDPSSLR